MTEQPDVNYPENNFISHLLELRSRLLKILIVIISIFFIMLPWSSQIYDWLAYPLIVALPIGSKMIATGIITPFSIPLKITFLVAFIISLPWVLYQTWAFIAPGLYLHEKKLVLPLIISSCILFFSGMSFSYFFVFKTVFNFIVKMAPQSIAVAPEIGSYFDFVITMFIAFGLAFEVPVVVIILTKMQIVSIAKLKKIRPYIIVTAFIVAAITTPPDVMSQLLLAIPLCLLYECGLLFAPFFVKTEKILQD